MLLSASFASALLLWFEEPTWTSNGLDVVDILNGQSATLHSGWFDSNRNTVSYMIGLAHDGNIVTLKTGNAVFSNGAWQPFTYRVTPANYGGAGQYTILVTLNDGASSKLAELTLIVHADTDNDGVPDDEEPANCVGQNQNNVPADTACTDWSFNAQTGCHQANYRPAGYVVRNVDCSGFDTTCKIFSDTADTCDGRGNVVAGVCSAWTNNAGYSNFVDCPTDRCDNLGNWVDFPNDGFDTCVSGILHHYQCIGRLTPSDRCRDSDNDGINDADDLCDTENQQNLPADTACTDWSFNTQTGCHDADHRPAGYVVSNVDCSGFGTTCRIFSDTTDTCDGSGNVVAGTCTVWTNNNAYSSAVDCPSDRCQGENLLDYIDDGNSVCAGGALQLYTCTFTSAYNAQCDTDDDNDGVPDTNDRCPNTAPGEAVDADGCSCTDKAAQIDDGNVCTVDACNPATARITHTGFSAVLNTYSCQAPQDGCVGDDYFDYPASYSDVCTNGVLFLGDAAQCLDPVITLDDPRCITIDDHEITSVELRANPSEGEAPLNVWFECLVEGGDAPFTYVWNFGDGTPQQSTGVNSIFHIYQSEGNVRARCTVTDEDGDSDFGVTDIAVGTAPDDNLPPVADFTWTPADPEVNDLVTFTSTSTDPDGDSLTYEWDIYGDGSVDSRDDEFDFTFDAPGRFGVRLTVTDEHGASDFAVQFVDVTGQLESGLDCMSPIIVDHAQVCNVHVEVNGQPEGDALVELFYNDGNKIGECTTDDLAGGCGVQFIETELGTQRVYAEATKPGFDPADRVYADYDVFAEAYEISDLGVYENDAFSIAEDEFYRGNPMYVKFRVKNTAGDFMQDMVSSVVLQSPETGGRGDFLVFDGDGSDWYYYFFDIPPTHEFKGDSQVFTFVFDFTDGTGAQLTVDVAILNNPPHISDTVVDEFRGVFDASTIINLAAFKSDIEDSGSDLTWGFADVATNFGVSINNVDELTIIPTANGTGTFRLILSDLDEDVDEVLLTVETVYVEPYVPECGNSILDAGEECDDGNLLDMDGCTAICTLEQVSPVVVRPEEPFVDSETLFINRISIGSNRVNNRVDAGDLLGVAVSMENNRNYDLEDVKLTVSIAELGVRDTDKFDLDAGDTKTAQTFLDIPEWVEPGFYDLKVVVSNDDFHKVRYREVMVG